MSGDDFSVCSALTAVQSLVQAAAADLETPLRVGGPITTAATPGVPPAAPRKEPPPLGRKGLSDTARVFNKDENAAAAVTSAAEPKAALAVLVQREFSRLMAAGGMTANQAAAQALRNVAKPPAWEKQI